MATTRITHSRAVVDDLVDAAGVAAGCAYRFFFDVTGAHPSKGVRRVE